MWLKRAAGNIQKWIHTACRVMNYVGFTFLFVMMLLIVVHVIGRYFFDRPVPGTVEIIELLMTLVVFLGFGYMTVQRGNVRVDVFLNIMPKKFQAIVNALTCLFSIGIVSLITWQSVVQMEILWVSKHVSGVLHIPHYPFLFVAVIGFAAFGIVLVEHFFLYLREVFKK